MDVTKFADMLQTWEDGKGAIGFKEVLAWEITPQQVGIALRGDALKIERRINFGESAGMLPNKHYRLDVSLQRALGLDARTEYQGMRPIGVEGGLGQTMDDDSAHVADVMHTIRRAGEELLDKGLHATIMPDEGSPWNPGEDKTPYYNARTQKTATTSKPDWLVEVEIRDEDTGRPVKAPGADFCRFATRVRRDAQPGFTSMRARGQSFLVTHCFNLVGRTGDWQSKAEHVKRCGGYLFPSLAVGQVPSAGFGTVVLIMDPMVVLQGLKPYRSKGRWPVAVYTTDTWTETMSSFLGDAAHVLYGQLTGQWEIGYYGMPHQYILGPLVLEEGGPAGGNLIGDTKKLVMTLIKRAKAWPPGLTNEQLDELRERQQEETYPYLEAKANVVIDISCVRACAFPTYLSSGVRAYLKRIGFQGKLLPIRVDDQDALETYTNREALYRYSWAVHHAAVAAGASLEVS